MRAFLPALWAALLPVALTGAHLVLAAERVPELDVDPSCRAAGQVATAVNGSTETCKRQEQQARNKLTQEWDKFSAAQQDHCVRLAQLGGHPSYVELITCLEMSQAADNLPAEKNTDRKATGGMIR